MEIENHTGEGGTMATGKTEISLSQSNQQLTPEAIGYERLKMRTELIKIFLSNPTIILVSLILMIYMIGIISLCFSDKVQSEPLISKSLLPVVTAYMGYLFGKGSGK